MASLWRDTQGTDMGADQSVIADQSLIKDLTTLAIVAAGGLAITFQTWLSYQITLKPPESLLGRRFVLALFLLTGLTAFGATVATAWDDLQSIKAILDGMTDIKEDLDKIARDQAAAGTIRSAPGTCDAQETALRYLALLQIREDYRRERPDDATANWPPQRYVDQRLRDIKATWKARVSSDRATIEIK
jgi:hypothetical protein